MLNRFLPRVWSFLRLRPQAGAERNASQPSGKAAGLAAASAPAGRQQPGGIMLEAAAGEAVQGLFLVENLLPGPVRGEIVATALRGPDSGEVTLPFAFEPPVAVLNPRDQLLARLSVVVPGELAPGVPYTGAISIPGLKGTSIPLVVRRLPEKEKAPLPGSLPSGGQESHPGPPLRAL